MFHVHTLGSTSTIPREPLAQWRRGFFLFFLNTHPIRTGMDLAVELLFFNLLSVPQGDTQPAERCGKRVGWNNYGYRGSYPAAHLVRKTGRDRWDRLGSSLHRCCILSSAQFTTQGNTHFCNLLSVTFRGKAVIICFYIRIVFSIAKLSTC